MCSKIPFISIYPPQYLLYILYTKSPIYMCDTVVARAYRTTFPRHGASRRRRRRRRARVPTLRARESHSRARPRAMSSHTTSHAAAETRRDEIQRRPAPVDATAGTRRDAYVSSGILRVHRIHSFYSSPDEPGTNGKVLYRHIV
jgi:hypothetical protein